MRSTFVLLLSLFLATAAFGQHRGGSNTYGSLGGFGSVVYPGTGHPPPPGGSSVVHPGGFATSLSGTVSGSTPYRGVARGANGRGRYGVAPYAYGVVGGYGYVPDYGAGYGPGYGYDNQPQTNVTIINPPAQAPQVVINQNFGAAPQVEAGEASDNIHFFQATPAQPVADTQPAETPYYLIAYKDHSIYSVRAYWVADNTLHYITTQNTHNQASLDLIDFDFTKKLNNDRNVSFAAGR